MKILFSVFGSVAVCFAGCSMSCDSSFVKESSDRFEQIVSERFINSEHVKELKDRFQRRHDLLEKEAFQNSSEDAYIAAASYSKSIALFKALEDYRAEKNESSKMRLKNLAGFHDEAVYDAVQIFIGEADESEDGYDDDNW